MKKLLTVATIAILLASCSTDDSVLREVQNCNCDITTEVYENSDPTSTVITSSITTVIDSCDNDGNFSSDVNSDNQYTTESWSCSQ